MSVNTLTKSVCRGLCLWYCLSFLLRVRPAVSLFDRLLSAICLSYSVFPYVWLQTFSLSRLSVSLSVHPLTVFLSAHLSVSLSVRLSVCQSVDLHKIFGLLAVDLKQFSSPTEIPAISNFWKSEEGAEAPHCHTTNLCTASYKIDAV